MLSNQMLQKIITDIQGIIHTPCSVWSIEGICLANTGEQDEYLQGKVQMFADSGLEEKCLSKVSFFQVCDDGDPKYILAIEGNLDHMETTGRLCACQMEHLIQAYKARVDKKKFYQNLLLQNMLPVDVLNQAKKLGVEVEARRVLFVIEPRQEDDNLIIETLKGLYATGTKDYVTSVEENNIVLVKTLSSTENYKDVNYIARTIVDTLNAEAMVSVRVAYSTIVQEIRDVYKAYKEAVMALNVGRIFYEEKNILAYNELGIGRLIHQIPISLCDMFLDEVFAEDALEQLDEETLTTVNTFFENSLNISETARKLYIHRNTLVYRLEKLQKTTGLDVKVFDDALTFKIALMVAKHMKSMQ